MKKKIFSLSLWLLCLLAFIACKSGEDVPDTPPTPPTPNNEWNKDNTINLYFVSSLKDETANTNIQEVISYFNQKGNACTVGIVERTDMTNFANHEQSFNAPSELSFKTGHFSAFALQKYNAGNIEGSTILFNHKINTTECQPVTADCFIKYTPVQAQTIAKKPAPVLLPLCTVRFSTIAQIEASTKALQQFTNNSYKAVIIGTVKSTLAQELKAKVEEETTMKLTFVSDYADEYTVFMAARSSWVLRQTTAEMTGTLKALVMSIESGVK